LEEKIKEIVGKWKELPDEEKYRIIREILDYFTKRSRESPALAFIEFNTWLASGDGAIIWPWLWKREYREVMIEIAYYYLKIITMILAAKAPKSQT